MKKRKHTTTMRFQLCIKIKLCSHLLIRKMIAGQNSIWRKIAEMLTKVMLLKTLRLSKENSVTYLIFLKMTRRRNNNMSRKKMRRNRKKKMSNTLNWIEMNFTMRSKRDFCEITQWMIWWHFCLTMRGSLIRTIMFCINHQLIYHCSCKIKMMMMTLYIRNQKRNSGNNQICIETLKDQEI